MFDIKGGVFVLMIVLGVFVFLLGVFFELEEVLEV